MGRKNYGKNQQKRHKSEPSVKHTKTFDKSESISLPERAESRKQSKSIEEKGKTRTTSAKNTFQNDLRSINASEVAAFTAVMTAGFLFSKFCFSSYYEKEILNTLDMVNHLSTELIKIEHRTNYDALIITLLSSAFSFFTTLIKIDKKASNDSLVERIFRLKKWSQNHRKYFYLIIIILLGIIGISSPFILASLSNAASSFIILALIFIGGFLIIIQGNPTPLALYCAFYIEFCFILTFLFLIPTQK